MYFLLSERFWAQIYLLKEQDTTLACVAERDTMVVISIIEIDLLSAHNLNNMYVRYYSYSRDLISIVLCIAITIDETTFETPVSPRE